MTIGPLRRVILAAGLLAAALGTVVLYLLPSVTAASFVTVRPVITCDGHVLQADPTVGPCGSQLTVAVRIDNGYPLPVTLGFTGDAFKADLARVEGGPPVWTAVADDPLLEQTSDSPDGTGDRAAVLPAGTSQPAMGWPLVLDLKARALAAGRYELWVRAYGVESDPVVVIVAPPTGLSGPDRPW